MKKSKTNDQESVDFKALLELPERLTRYLRLLLHVSKTDWDFMVDKVRQGEPYKEWKKSKGPGKGFRHFAAPCEELKDVQTKILNQFLGQVPIHFCRHGGTKGSSIFTNAEHHAGFAKTVFAIDIVDAYPGVYRSRVRACLKKPFEFTLRQFAGVEFSDVDIEQLLETIVDLTTWKQRLPQGPPTSPRLFNIVCMKMDKDLYDLVHASSNPFHEYRITIYSDNITISSDNEIPEEFRNEVVSIMRGNGFKTHTRKDKMTYFSPETGLVPIITGLILTNDGRMVMHPQKVNQIRGKLGKMLTYKRNWDEEQRGEIAGLVGYTGQLYPRYEDLPSKLRKIVPLVKIRLKGFHFCGSKKDKTFFQLNLLVKEKISKKDRIFFRDVTEAKDAGYSIRK